MSRFAIGGPPGPKFNDMSDWVFLPNFFWESQYMLGSQEKILEPKVNVKFFTVDPYTPCYRVSRPFPIWSIWQIWPLLGQKNMFFGGLVNWGNEIWIVFG